MSANDSKYTKFHMQNTNEEEHLFGFFLSVWMKSVNQQKTRSECKLNEDDGNSIGNGNGSNISKS